MPWKPAAGAARLIGAVLGGCLVALAAPPARASDLLQASSNDQDVLLVDRGVDWAVILEGRDPIVLPKGAGERYDALVALDAGDGWLAAGHRPSAQGAGRELMLVRGGAAAPRELPVPPAGNRLLLSPQPLVERGELVGLVWLEGEAGRSLGVRAAAWTGAGFAPAEWVAPPAETGSQLALSATVLGDGGWLLVWSAFDGEDDEILWSVREGDRFTPPARLHAGNAVPDVTPVVAATRRGAVAAWSRYEAGHYRVRVARFRDGVWSGEERLGGPGSAFPFFLADESARDPLLIYPTGPPGDWELLELGGAGQVGARSLWHGPAGERPRVERGAAGAARLAWMERPVKEAQGP